MIKIKNLLTESVDLKYVDEFQKYFEKKYDGKKIDGWELEVDQMTGTFYWASQKSKNLILATPFWEGRSKLPVNVIDMDGEELIDTSYPLKSTGDFKKDEANYIKLMKRIFKSIR